MTRYMAYEFVFLFVLVLESIAIEIGTFNAVKKRTYFVSLAPSRTAFELRLLPSRTQVRFFMFNKWCAKLVIQVLVEYQVPNLEMVMHR